MLIVRQLSKRFQPHSTRTESDSQSEHPHSASAAEDFHSTRNHAAPLGQLLQTSRMLGAGVVYTR
jgi:hypothetical protein